MMKPMRTPYDFHLDKKTRFLPRITQPMPSEEVIEAISLMLASVANNTRQTLESVKNTSTVGVAGKHYPCNRAIDMVRSREISIGYRLDVGTGPAKITDVGLRNDDGKWQYSSVSGI
ncbi:hypothetical protein [Serratia sp. N21D137]|uniref:hypothetical protein n=1 Tax=Serratia sp. N21D137 TaxID=3397495 RepID=UPI0039E0AB5C